LFIKKIKNIILIKNNYFLFGLVFIKKNNQTEFFFKKTETEPKPVQTDWVQFGFLGQKPVQTGLARFFPVLARFFLGLALFFSGLARFGFGSVFLIFAYKTETESILPVFSKF